MNHWATILDIIDAGIVGDKEKCRAYAELLLSKLDEAEPMKKSLEAILQNKPKGRQIYLAVETKKMLQEDNHHCRN